MSTRYQTSIPLLTDLEGVFSKFKKIPISVYTNEFDLSMIRVFFPLVVCKLGYLPGSLALVDDLTEEIASTHTISISRRKSEKSDLFSSITTDGTLFVHHFKGIPVIIDEDEEENKNIQCSYIDSLFPPGHNGSLHITTIGKYSITSATYSKQLCDLIRKLDLKAPGSLKDNCSNFLIFDATACVGGDTIGFGIYLKCKVIGMEKDPINFKTLQNNISAYKFKNSVECVQGDFITDGYKIIETRMPDIVYFDPPWGGKDYSIQKDLELYLSDKNVKEIVFKILEEYPFVKTVIVKVPSNFNIKDIKMNFSVTKMKKFDILFFTRSISK